MSFLHIAAALLLVIVSTSPTAGNNPAQILAAHPVWISEDLKWEQDPGDREQSWAAARIVYFRSDGRFGIFDGIVLRQGRRLALGEGEGQLDNTGTWGIKKDEIEVEYRLTFVDKVMRPKGEPLLKIPGPVQNAKLRLESSQQSGPKPKYTLTLEGKTFEIAVGFGKSEVGEHFGRLFARDVSVGSSIPGCKLTLWVALTRMGRLSGAPISGQSARNRKRRSRI